jgi:predicted enzyme related to lactoylglutathione lyase
MRDVTEIPEAGWMSIIVDPTGAMLALWKPKPRVHGCHGPPEGGH